MAGAVLLAPYLGTIADSGVTHSSTVPISAAGPPPPPGGGPGPTPQVGPNVAFSVPSTTPTSSPQIHTAKGDAIFVWLAIANRGGVGSIADSAGDRFTAISPEAFTGPYAGSDAIALWAATNVAGTPGTTLTVTLTAPRSGVSTAAAVEAYDVGGVGPTPVDQVGPTVSSYSAEKGATTSFAAPVWAAPHDLVLSGVVSEKSPNWGPAGGVHPIATRSAQLSPSSTPEEVATFQQPSGGSWSYAWANATANSAVLWVGEALAVMPASTPTTKYPITFSESGVASGTVWSATLIESTSSAPAPSSISFSERSGAYPFSVGAAHYAATPISGTVNVGNGAVAVSSKFVEAPPIQHVVVIVLENEGSSAVLAGAPYERYLANTYGFASSFYGGCHYSYPNYASMTSGRYFACGSASIPIEGVPNLGDLLDAAGQSWMGYFESMSGACQVTSSGEFAAYHDPFILYKDIRYNTSRCDQHIVNSAQFNSSVASGTLPAFSYFIPNLQDDCEQSTLAFCDHWLSGFLGGMLNSSSSGTQSLMASTAFLITYDEALAKDTSGYLAGGDVNNWCQQATGHPMSVCGGLVYTTVVSPYSHGTQLSSDASPYNLESTVEWLLGVVGNDGGWDGTAAFPPMTGIFTVPPATYPVTFTESGLSGSTWSVTLHATNGSSSTRATNSTSISFDAPNGTYSYTVGAPTGFAPQPASGSVQVAGQSPPTVAISFVQTYAVAFDESGLSGESWSISLTATSGAPVTLSATGSTITFQEPNGSYSYTVTAPAGYTATPSSGSITVAGQSPSAVNIVFVPVVLSPTQPATERSP